MSNERLIETILLTLNETWGESHPEWKETQREKLRAVFAQRAALDPIDLKPRPFCGETLDESNPDIFEKCPVSNWGAVVCVCDCSGPGVHTDKAHWQSQAKAAWNSRPTPPEAKREWQPIATAPKDGTRFLAIIADSQYPSVAWWYDNPGGTWGISNRPVTGWHALGHSNQHEDISITHWMPLPLPPSAC